MVKPSEQTLSGNKYLLSMAIQNSDYKKVKNIIENAKIYLSDNNFVKLINGFNSIFNPLIKAIDGNNLQIVKYLVKNGANIYEIDNYGKNALDYSKKHGRSKIYDYLINEHNLNLAFWNAEQNGQIPSDIYYSIEEYMY